MWSSEEEDEEDEELESSNEELVKLLKLLREKLKIAFLSKETNGSLILDIPHGDHSVFVRRVLPEHLCAITVKPMAWDGKHTTVTCLKENIPNLIEAATLADRAVFTPMPGRLPPANC
ncbi:MAG: hypothetical protein DHS20C10_03890 [marine bacterium B5-7]|nr:MAG: hypothetical protein DHS20C10_03890 [marine bacterium B5-7]